MNYTMWWLGVYYDCEYRGYGNREVVYCHYFNEWPDISKYCDFENCPIKEKV